MSSEEKKEEKPNAAVIIAAIGALATILTACVTGFFGMLPALMERTDPPAQQAAALATASPTATAMPQATSAPNATPTELPGLLFASKVAANGQAVDPGVEFPAGITDLYAVFPPGMTPPGTGVNAASTLNGAYYAFLRVAQEGGPSSIGWRWLRNGETVNEYEIDVSPGESVWLSYSNSQPGGIFSGDPYPPGRYTIVITLGGNASVSGELLITP